MKTLEANIIFILFLPFLFLGVIASVFWQHIMIGWYFSDLHLSQLYQTKDKL